MGRADRSEERRSEAVEAESEMARRVERGRPTWRARGLPAARERERNVRADERRLEREA